MQVDVTADINEITRLLFEATVSRDLPGMADINSSLLYYCREVKKEMLEKDFFPWIHDAHKRISLFEDSIVRPKGGYEFVKTVYKKSVEACPLLESDNDTMKQSRIAT